MLVDCSSLTARKSPGYLVFKLSLRSTRLWPTGNCTWCNAAWAPPHAALQA